MKKTAQKLVLISILLSIFAACGIFVLLKQTHAQTVNQKITIVPPSYDFTVKPGDKKEGVLKVKNEGDQAISFKVNVQDFIVDDTKGTPDFVPQGTFAKQFSASAWIGVVPDSFTVAPHSTMTLNYYLQVPLSARPGGHYAGVLYQPVQSLGGTKDTGPAVQAQLGTLFSLDVAGPIHEQAQVTKFMAEHGFYEYGPVSMLTQIKNMGDLHIKPLANITITDMLGRRIAQIPLDEHNIFPLAARDFVNVFGDKWMFGPFTAKLVGTYGRDGNLPLTATVTFWVIPWKVTIVVILLIVAAIMGYFYWKKKKQGPYHSAENQAKPMHHTNDQQPMINDQKQSTNQPQQ